MERSTIIFIILTILIFGYIYFFRYAPLKLKYINVPKIIYLCYKTKDIPSTVVNKWKSLNPDYEVKLYDNQDCEKFLLDNYGQKYVDIFNYIKDGPIKGCFFRICIINKNGGVYSDIDIEPLVPIKDFIENDVTFATCNSMYPRMLNPHFIYSVKNHPILKRCLEIYEQKYDNKDQYEYWLWSSPYIMIKSFYDIFGENFDLKQQMFYDKDGKKYQFLQEVNPNTENGAHDIYCEYKGVKILNNRSKNYDPDNHKFKNESTTVIPLDIYQTWGTKDLSPKMKECIETLKKENPEFTHHLYDDNDCYKFIKDNFDKNVADAYDNIIPGAYKADLWRYCILYKKGGIYLDIKYYTVNGFKLINLTDKEYFVRDIEVSGRGIYNAFMICKAGNSHLLKAINKIVENVKNNYYGKTIFSPTGPILLREQFTDDELKNATENGLELCDVNDNNTCPTKTCISLNKNAILAIYEEYRNEQHSTKKTSYYDLWYQRKIYKNAQNNKLPYDVVIAGTARDIEKYLPGTKNKLEMVKSLFRSGKIIIYENDSKDKTLDILKHWEKEGLIQLITEKNIPGKRTQRLSHGRNTLLKEAMKNKFDFYIVMDLDDIIEKLEPEGVLSTFKMKEDWAMVGGNQINRPYYDIWTLRTFDDWLDFDYLVCKDIERKGEDYCFKSRLREIPPDAEPIQVKSCFGGIGIYKKKYLENCNYGNGLRNNTINVEECEHVKLNECITRNGGKIYINPKMITA